MKPIDFDAKMIRPILDGRKTVARSPVMPQPDEDGLVFDTRPGAWIDTNERRYEAPYCTGDVLWVRETCTPYCMNKENPMKHIYIHEDYCYKATFSEDCRDYDHPGTCKWMPSICMPKEAARIFLRVTKGHAERLQEMTLDEFFREGIDVKFPAYISPMLIEDYIKPDMKQAFANFWDGTIEPADLPTYSWSSNPWVWVVSFERISKKEAFGL